MIVSIIVKTTVRGLIITVQGSCHTARTVLYWGLQGGEEEAGPVVRVRLQVVGVVFTARVIPTQLSAITFSSNIGYNVQQIVINSSDDVLRTNIIKTSFGLRNTFCT